MSDPCQKEEQAMQAAFKELVKAAKAMTGEPKLTSGTELSQIELEQDEENAQMTFDARWAMWMLCRTTHFSVASDIG